MRERGQEIGRQVQRGDEEKEKGKRRVWERAKRVHV